MSTAPVSRADECRRGPRGRLRALVRHVPRPRGRPARARVRLRQALHARPAAALGSRSRGAGSVALPRAVRARIRGSRGDLRRAGAALREVGFTDHDGALSPDHVAWVYSPRGPTATGGTSLGEDEHVFLALTNPAEGRDRDLNAWYDVHVGEIVEQMPGFVAGRRYEARPERQRPGQTPRWSYLALYDLEGDLAEIHRRDAEVRARGTLTPADGAFDRASPCGSTRPSVPHHRSRPRPGAGMRLGGFLRPETIAELSASAPTSTGTGCRRSSLRDASVRWTRDEAVAFGSWRGRSGSSSGSRSPTSTSWCATRSCGPSESRRCARSFARRTSWAATGRSSSSAAWPPPTASRDRPLHVHGRVSRRVP